MSNGQTVACAKQDAVLVPIAKVTVYAMGKVAPYPQAELRQLQQFKQTDRKRFDRNPDNERRLSRIKKLKHNYDRSQSMLTAIQQVGFIDSIEATNTLIVHLLNMGQHVTSANRLNYQSKVEGPAGQLNVFSTWVILENNMRYLSTLRFIPKVGV